MKLLPTLCFGVLVEADVGDQLVTYEGRGVAGQEDYRRPGIKKSWSGRGKVLKKTTNASEATYRGACILRRFFFC